MNNANEEKITHLIAVVLLECADLLALCSRAERAKFDESGGKSAHSREVLYFRSA